MMDTIEDFILFLRVTAVGLSIFSVFIWIAYYIKYKQPMAIAIITWLVNLVGFNIYRFFIEQETLVHTRLTNTWSVVLHLHAVVLLIVAYYIFKDRKK